MNGRDRVGDLPFDEPCDALGEPRMFDCLKTCLLQALTFSPHRMH